MTDRTTKTVTLTGSQRDALDVLREIAQGRRDDYDAERNLMTSHATYTVQERRDVWGVDPERWRDIEHKIHDGDTEREFDDMDVPDHVRTMWRQRNVGAVIGCDGWEIVAVARQWRTIRVCLTHAGAQRLVDGHDNRRVYVDSAHNMPELRALYAALGELLEVDA